MFKVVWSKNAEKATMVHITMHSFQKTAKYHNQYLIGTL